MQHATSCRLRLGPYRRLGALNACAACTQKSTSRGPPRPPRRRGREAWAPPRSVRPRPGPRLQLARDHPEPGSGRLNRAGSAWKLQGGGGPGDGGPWSGCRGDRVVTRPEGGSEKVAGVPRRVGGAVRAARRWGALAVACPRSCWPSTRI